MTQWTREAVLADFADGYWVPPSAREVQTDLVHFHLLERRARVLDVTPSELPTAQLVESVRRTVAEHGAQQLRWTTLPNSPADLEPTLLALDGEITDRMDICAYDLGVGLPDIPVPDDVTVVPAETPADKRDVVLAGWLGWGNPEPTEQELDRMVERSEGGDFLARLGGRPAGRGGYSLAGGVARLWAGAVVPEHRGRGVYRGLVDTRLRHAAACGATLALVGARVSTSAPILHRLGFTVYGQAVQIDVPVK